MIQREKIAQILENAYARLENTNDKITKASILYTIIQVKNNHSELSDIHQSSYIDTKQFVDTYINGVVESDSDYGYDNVDVNKIIFAVQVEKSNKKRIQLWKRTESELTEHGLNGECEAINSYCKKSIIRESFCSNGLVGWLKGICYISVYNVWTVLITLLLVFIIEYIVTLPLSNADMPMFIIEHEQYSNNMYWNHFLTYYASVFELTEKSFCKAGSLIGFIVLMAFKLFYICYGGWHAANIIQKKLTLNNE
jgi:hypothetical protein